MLAFKLAGKPALPALPKVEEPGLYPPPSLPSTPEIQRARRYSSDTAARATVMQPSAAASCPIYATGIS
jgi:hypothetical protein